MRDLFAALRDHADHSGDRLAFDDGTIRLGFGPLAQRVAGAAEDLLAIPSPADIVGILGGNQVDSIVTLLAAWYAGKTVVPLPPFFAISQLQHVVRDAGISHVISTADMAGAARRLSCPFMVASQRCANPVFEPREGSRQIIYTSGSTGQPKGVLLGGGQMLWTASALARALQAQSDDVYLSILPLALLLETLCAVIVPILAGAHVRLDPALTTTFDNAEGGIIAQAVEEHRPSCMVLVPQLLSQWMSALVGAGARAPDSLRVVAVGGAPVSPVQAQRAWNLGIPVCEGYGLSECGSVVALNRPGDRKPGTVGKALPGLEIFTDDGEIVVRGPSVMERYLHGAATDGVWRTGDAGEIDPEGVLTVHGRLDNRLVTPIGRNISPEWIESLLLADPRIAQCILTDIGGNGLTAILVPTEESGHWLRAAAHDEISALVARTCHEAPHYALPQQYVILRSDELARLGVLTGNGRIRRKPMLEAYASMLESGAVIPAPISQWEIAQ